MIDPMGMAMGLSGLYMAKLRHEEARRISEEIKKEKTKLKPVENVVVCNICGYGVPEDHIVDGVCKNCREIKLIDRVE